MLILAMVLLLILLYYLQSFLYKKYWETKLDMKLYFSAKEAFEGEELSLKEEIINKKIIPIPWLKASFQLPKELEFKDNPAGSVTDFYYQHDMFYVGAYRRIVRQQEFTCVKRGFYHVQSMDITSGDPLGRLQFVKQMKSDAELTVFPKLLPFEETEVFFKQINGEIELRRFTNPDPFSFRGIREYMPGDSLKNVNFKATAKAGDIMVNINGATASQEVIILLNVEPYIAYSSSRLIEEAIRIAATAANYFCEQGLQVGLCSNGRHILSAQPTHVYSSMGNGQFNSILHALACIDLTQDALPMQEILKNSTDESPLYLLISSNASAEIQQEFEAMRNRGQQPRWIVPLFEEDKMPIEENECISRWNIQ